MFSSLRVRDFRLYWFGMLISLIGSWIQTVAQSWLMFDLTHSAFLLGFAGFLTFIPVFLFTLLAGVVADRVNKIRILLVTQSAFMVLAFALGLLAQTKLITTGHIMAIAALNGIVMAFDGPSRQAIVAELVGRQHLLNAIALNSAAFNSARIIGPAFAGILIAAVGMSGCFYINGASFLAVIAALLMIKNRERLLANCSNTHAFTDLKQGLAFIVGNKKLLALIGMVAVISLCGFSYVILMPVVAADILHVGAKGFSILMSCAGIGALTAALTLAGLGDFRHKGLLLRFAAITFGLALMVFSLSKTYTVSLLVLIAIGWSSVTTLSIINTLLQTNVPDNFRGRIMSAYMFTFSGMMPLGNLLAGWLAHILGVMQALMLGGLVCFIFFVSLNLKYPQLSSL